VSGTSSCYSSIVRSSSCVTLVLGWALFACTSHESANDDDARQETEPAPTPAPAVSPEPLVSSVPPPPLRTGPITALQYKPIVGVLGELTGDGQPDVLALCHTPDGSALVLSTGQRDGSFIEGEPKLTEGTGLALGDFDGDVGLDALLLDASGAPAYRVALNDGMGNFSIRSKRPIPGRYGGELRSATIFDLDADGDLDAIVPLWDELRVLLGDGTGELEPGSRFASGRDPFATALADVDGDGHLDLAASSGAGPATHPDHYESAGASAWIYRGSARGFADPVRVEVSGAHQLAFADLDGDGRAELVVSGSGGLTVIREALGEALAEHTLVATDGPLLIADLLESPGPELITTSYIQGSVHLLTDYPKLDKVSVEAGSYVVGLFAGDIARDGGRPDLVLLDAGPPTGPNMPPAAAIEVLWSSD
jgi:hypothetical protein